MVQKVFQRRGTVEILIALSDAGELRFSEIDQGLPNIAPQVIGARLGDLRELNLVNREVEEGPPTSSTYSLTSLGVELAKVAGGLKAVAHSPELPQID